MRRLFHLAVFFLAPLVPLAKAAEKPACKVRITVSKETTHVTAPLRPDGTVDYAAALNERFGRGVTPENNAVVLLWQAAGPAEIRTEFRDAYFKLLGVAAPLEEGDYFQDFGDHAVAALAGRGPPGEMDKALEKLYDQWAKAEARPWAKEAFPELAAWLELQGKHLSVALDASRRERYFSPLVCAQAESVSDCFLRANDLAHFRAMARAFCVRATLRAGMGKAHDASQDLLATRRLARLKVQGPFLVDLLMGGALESMACQSAAGIAQSGHLSAEDLRKLQADLAPLAPLRSVADVMDEGERLFGLDSLVAIPRDPDKAMRLLLDESLLHPGIENLLLCGALLLTLQWCAGSCRGEETVGQRPYEMVWANRASDTRPALVDFEDLAGWKVETKDAEAAWSRSREQQLWGDYVGKLVYREALAPLTFEPRPKRGVAPFRGQATGTNTGPGTLPFPTREETILPDNLTADFKTTLEQQGEEYAFRYRGADGELVYR